MYGKVLVQFRVSAALCVLGVSAMLSFKPDSPLSHRERGERRERKRPGFPKCTSTSGIRVYRIHFIKYQIPKPAAPITATKTKLNNTITSLNFRYRCLSGGANELCGKYGGGVYVAMLNPSESASGRSDPPFLTPLPSVSSTNLPGASCRRESA